MNDDDPEGVARLPVRFKKPLPKDRTLVTVWETGKAPGCDHLFAQYIVNQAEAEVECARCGTRLNPMWVLSQIATHDRRYADSQKRYQDEQRRLAERTRTKCQHCGQMTRISRR